MKVVLKTLTGETHDVEVTDDTTILSLKEEMFKLKGEKYYVEGVKLIYCGKIMSDDQTIKSASITDGSFFVVMPGKARKTPAPAAAAAESSAMDTSESAAAAAAAPATASAPATPAAGPTLAASDTSVDNLVGMGFPREEAVRALQAAFGNEERAAEYLLNGIPDGAAAPMLATPAPAAATAEAPAASPAAAPAAAAAAPSGGVNPNSDLAFLLTNPNFLQLRSLVQRQPTLLPTLLQQLGENNPDLISLINNNQEDFYQILNSTDGPGPRGAAGGAPPGGVQIQVSEEESAAIERLCSLGFDRNIVIQAYFACDKNENAAANFLLNME